jgi:hypothetical protein
VIPVDLVPKRAGGDKCDQEMLVRKEGGAMSFKKYGSVI